MQYFQIEKKRERNVHSDVVIRFPETKILVCFFFNVCNSKDFQNGVSSKEPACQYRRQKRHGFDPLVRKVT